MKVVGLVSGGKDSCFNLMKCVEHGHEIVCLANLYPPPGKDELDSYMYQTVGHDAIQAYGEAMGMPLYRREITGTPLAKDSEYEKTEADEVEDLYELLVEVQAKHPDVKGVSAGAIFSNYQKVRVENVCERLGLTPLCFLWEREQSALMAEMIAAGVNAILIKVAAMGLDPQKHLGLTLPQILPHLNAMNDKYGLNVCGEGGEFESFVLDCPLFKKRIVIDDQQIVIHSDDAFAKVGYLRLNKFHLEEKPAA
uniref:Diphthine--ammonia ligase n=1 Tax=Plectus sambesii TaxID=2011161 RepID=A0A914VL11_9BILA